MPRRVPTVVDVDTSMSLVPKRNSGKFKTTNLSTAISTVKDAYAIGKTVYPWLRHVYDLYKGSPSFGPSDRVTKVSRPAIYGVRIRTKSGVGDLQSLTASYTVGTIAGGKTSATQGQDGLFIFRGYDGGGSSGYQKSIVIPIAPGDASWGLAALGNIITNYAKIRFRSIHLQVFPLRGNTSDNGSLHIAPYRGGGFKVETPGASTTLSTPNSATMTDVADDQACSMFDSINLDLTPFIDGGSGPQRNIFITNSTISNTSIPDNVLSIPCGFIVGGNAGSAVIGADTHIVRCTVVIDLLDWLANILGDNPTLFGRAAKSQRSDQKKVSMLSTSTNVDDNQIWSSSSSSSSSAMPTGRRGSEESDLVKIEPPVTQPFVLPTSPPSLVRGRGYVKGNQ